MTCSARRAVLLRSARGGGTFSVPSAVQTYQRLRMTEITTEALMPMYRRVSLQTATALITGESKLHHQACGQAHDAHAAILDAAT